MASHKFPKLYFSCVCFHSTVSSSINALVAVTVEDFMKPAWPSLTERQLSWINMGMSESIYTNIRMLPFRVKQWLID